jgi:hypothetical protein
VRRALLSPRGSEHTPLAIRPLNPTNFCRPRVYPESRRAPRSTVDWLVLPARVARIWLSCLLPPRISSRSSSSPDQKALTTFRVFCQPHLLLHPVSPCPFQEVSLRQPTSGVHLSFNPRAYPRSTVSSRCQPRRPQNGSELTSACAHPCVSYS